MTISAFYHQPEPEGGYVSPFPVAYFPDYPNAVTVISDTDPRVTDFVGGGGTIEAYAVPAAPPTNTEQDAASLNAALAAEGSVFRGFVLVMLDEINILRAEVQALKTKTSTAGAVPQRTLAQIKPAIQAKMR